MLLNNLIKRYGRKKTRQLVGEMSALLERKHINITNENNTIIKAM